MLNTQNFIKICFILQLSTYEVMLSLGINLPITFKELLEAKNSLMLDFHVLRCQKVLCSLKR